MVRGWEWTGFEAAALQEAMRQSVRDFALLLGLETTTVMNWRSGLGSVKPRSQTQAILDTTLAQRASPDDRARFEQIVAEGEEVWRKRHHGSQPTVEQAHAGGSSGIKNAEPAHEVGMVPPDDGGDRTNRRHVLRTLGIGGMALSGTGITNTVLDTARETAHIIDALNHSTVDIEVIKDAAEDLYQLASDYALSPDIQRLFVQLLTLRDQLTAAIARAGRVSDLSELYVLFAATCTLLASVSHDLAEPRAAMMQTRAAGRLADLAGHRSLYAWVCCTRAMIASWWGRPEQVIHEASRATQATGISRIRMSGLEARAQAQMGNREAALAAVATARHERERLSVPDSLTELGPIFDFSRARQHYYDASTFAALGEWTQAQREAQAVVDLYTPTHATTWPVTLTLAQINLAHARLHTDGANEALETLQPVLAVPIEQRIPQVVSALRTVRGGIGDHATSANQRTLAEAIDHFTTETGRAKGLHA